jgi:hypothetical protein
LIHDEVGDFEANSIHQVDQMGYSSHKNFKEKDTLSVEEVSSGDFS